MGCCTFFGHRDAPERIYPLLTEVMEGLIREGTDLFLIGHNGNFDRMAATAFRKLRAAYPRVDGAIVLAYRDGAEIPWKEDIETVLPTFTRPVPVRLSIVARNRWMLERADIAVTYVDHPGGSAAHFQELAYRKGKRVIPLGDYGRV